MKEAGPRVGKTSLELAASMAIRPSLQLTREQLREAQAATQKLLHQHCQEVPPLMLVNRDEVSVVREEAREVRGRYFQHLTEQAPNCSGSWTR